MIDHNKSVPKDMKIRISTLWIFIMLNMIAIDVFSLHIPGILEEMEKFAGDTPISQLMLIGAIMMEIPIAMVFLSRILKYKTNRVLNIVASIITILYIVGGSSTYPHYLFMGGLKL